MENEVRLSEEREPESITKLRAIAELEVPPLETYEEVQAFFLDNQVVETITDVLSSYGKSIGFGYEIKSGEFGTPPHFFKTSLEDDLSRIKIEGVDEIAQGYLRQHYNLQIPIFRPIGNAYSLDKRGRISLSVSRQTQALLDLKNPKSPAAPRPSYRDGIWVLKQGLGELLLHIDTEPPF